MFLATLIPRGYNPLIYRAIIRFYFYGFCSNKHAIIIKNIRGRCRKYFLAVKMPYKEPYGEFTVHIIKRISGNDKISTEFCSENTI